MRVRTPNAIVAFMSPIVFSFFLAAALSAPKAMVSSPAPADAPMVTCSQACTDWTQNVIVAARLSANPLGSLPDKLVMWRGKSTELTIAPTGASGPAAPSEFDSVSAVVHWDRLKADRLAGMQAMGGGVVVTLTEF